MLLFVGNFWGGSCMLRASILLLDGFHVWRSEGDRWVDSGVEQQRGVWFCVGFALSLRPRCRFGIGESVLRMGMRRGFGY